MSRQRTSPFLYAIAFLAVFVTCHRGEAQGTIDPATVSLRELLHYPKAVGSTEQPRFTKIDGAGNIYVGSVADSSSLNSGVVRFSSIVRKFDPQGNLLWSRARAITSFTDQQNPPNTTYFESWGDGTEHPITAQKFAVYNIELKGMTLDANGGVALAFDTFQDKSVYDSANRITITQTVYNNITLYVKFSTSGSYTGEYYSFPDSGGLYDEASQLRSFQTMPDGSFVALIWNYNFINAQFQTLVQRIGNDGSFPHYTVLYGADKNSVGQKTNSVDPIGLSFSGNNEVYVATSDLPTVGFPGDYNHVVRRLNATGSTIGKIATLFGNSQTFRTGDVWSGLKTDVSGSCYIGGSTLPDQVNKVENQLALKFAPDLSQQLWRTIVPNNSGITTGIELSPAGVTLAGTTNTFNSDLQALERWSVSRVSPAGGLSWQRFFAGQRYAGNGAASVLNEVVANSANEVLVYGFVPKQSGGTMGVIGKFADNGDLQFIKPIPANYNSSRGTKRPGFTFNTNGRIVYGDTYYSGDANNPAYATVALEIGNPPNIYSSRPVVTITSPASGTSFAFGEVVTISATINSGSLDNIALIVDNAIVNRVSPALRSDGIYTVSFELKTLVQGDHLIRVAAADSAGLTTFGSVRIRVQPPAGTTFNFIGAQGGDWNTASNWSPLGIPGAADSASVVNGAIVSVEGEDITVGSLAVDNAGVSGHGKLTLATAGYWTSGAFADVHVVVAEKATLWVFGNQEKRLVGVTVDNYGTTSLADTGPTGDTQSVFNNYGLFTFTLQTVQAALTGNTQAVLGKFNNLGKVSLAGGTLKALVEYIQTLGETALAQAGELVANLKFDGGSLTGSGTVRGNLTQTGGFLSPGHSPGLITINGNYTLGTAGTLILEVAGTNGAAGQFDQLNITGSASLNGNLVVQTIGGFTPAIGDTFKLLTSGTETGSFASVSSNAQATVSATGVTIKIDPSKPNPTTGQPLNIATRLQLQGGNNGLIEGFIITGPSGSTKKVLIRGIGPSLAQYNIPGLLTDPLLELHDGAGGLIVANDNWQSGDTSQIPTAFQPSDPRESVIVATLTVGANGSSAYSAVLKGANGETGVGVAEVYDFETGSLAKLANIATRGLVQTGDNVMIGGFIIGGTEPAKVLVRVTGPTLAKFNITGQLDDPTLELHDANGGVISNDNWRETQESEIIATTIPPADDREPAIFATLVPGSYSAVVRGKNNTTGIAVVEAYNLP